MDDSIEFKTTANRRAAARLASTLVELVEILLTDAAADVQVVARELGRKDEMRERLRRALDRVECARGVLGTVREVAGSEGAWEELPTERDGCGSADGEPHGNYENDNPIDVRSRAWSAMELLAKEWPQDYPEGAVEWLILGDLERSVLKHRATLR
jgi:hypothetical protein